MTDDTALRAELEAVTAERNDLIATLRNVREGRALEQQAIRNALPTLVSLRAERDRARDLAAHLEAELARLRDRVNRAAEDIGQREDRWHVRYDPYAEGSRDAYDIAEQIIRALLDEEPT